MWSFDIKKNFISSFARTMATNFSKVWLKSSWPQPVTWLIYHAIKLYLQKCTSPVSQHQWPLWVRVKRLQLLLKWLVDQVITYFLRNVINPLTQGHWNQLHIANMEKLTNQKLFFVIQMIFKFDSHRYTPL